MEKVPDSLTSLINLQELYLNDTYIEFLPANFGRLCNLRILELRDNNLTSLPKSLRRLTFLVRLDISNNDFSEMVIYIYLRPCVMIFSFNVLARCYRMYAELKGILDKWQLHIKH